MERGTYGPAHGTSPILHAQGTLNRPQGKWQVLIKVDYIKDVAICQEIPSNINHNRTQFPTRPATVHLASSRYGSWRGVLYNYAPQMDSAKSVWDEVNWIYVWTKPGQTPAWATQGRQRHVNVNHGSPEFEGATFARTTREPSSWGNSSLAIAPAKLCPTVATDSGTSQQLSIQRNPAHRAARPQLALRCCVLVVAAWSVSLRLL